MTDTLALTIGRHNIRMGGWVRKRLTNNLQPGAINTSWAFNTDYTNQPGINKTGFDYAGFLLGLPATMNYSIFPDYFRTRAMLYAAYIQDDFHVSKKLTLNLGLRWDALNFYHEAQNRSGVFDHSRAFGIAATTCMTGRRPAWKRCSTRTASRILTSQGAGVRPAPRLARSKGINSA